MIMRSLARYWKQGLADGERKFPSHGMQTFSVPGNLVALSDQMKRFCGESIKNLITALFTGGYTHFRPNVYPQLASCPVQNFGALSATRPGTSGPAAFSSGGRPARQ